MAVLRKQTFSKADMIRQRRSQQTGNSADHQKQHAQEMPALQNTPIFVRRGVVGTPVVQRTRTQVKRKIAVPMQDGSELVIPGLPIIHLSWRMVSGFLSLMLSVLITLISFSSLFDVKELSIKGLQRVNGTDIASVLKLEGKPAFLIDPQAVLAQMESSFPEFYDVKIQIGFPAAVNLQLTERQPVIAWQYDALTLWIDTEGNVFSPRGEAGGVISITSSVAPPRLKVQMTQAEIDLARGLGEEIGDDKVMLKDGPVDPELVGQILALHEKLPETTWLSYYPEAGFGWNDDSVDWNIYFGHKLDQLDQKILLYQTIRAYVLDQGININTLSVAHIRAPFYRLEQ